MKKDIASQVQPWLPIALTVIAASALSLEYWLQQAGRGWLCPTSACAVVGTFVKYGEKTFIGLGVVFFWVLAGLLYLGKRMDRAWLWMAIAILLTAGLAFDGGILGFQRFGIQEDCALCYAVGAALFLILLAYGWMRRSLAAVVMGVAVWTAGFASQALFLFPEKTPDLQEAVLTVHRGADPAGPKLYYFFSLRCPFCTQVMASLAAHPPQGGDWYLVPLDTSPDDQRKLSALSDHPKAATNPFQAILDLEQSPVPNVDISPRVAKAAHKGGVFLRNSGHRGVPLLLVQETPTKRVVLQGREPILNYLLEKRLIPFRLFF